MISGSVGSRGISQLPKGVEVASFRNYEQAVAAVTRLGQEGIELGAISIVGQNLYRVENIVGRITPGRVATQGALQGLTWGLMMGFILTFLGSFSIVWLLSIVLIGVCVGVLLAAGSWAISRNKPQFATHTQILAARYAVLVRAQADRAFQILQGMTGNLGPGGQPGREPLRSPRITEYNNYNPGFGTRQEGDAFSGFGGGGEAGSGASDSGFSSAGVGGIGGGSVGSSVGFDGGSAAANDSLQAGELGSRASGTASEIGSRSGSAAASSDTASSGIASNGVASGAGETSRAAASTGSGAAAGTAEAGTVPAAPTEFGSRPDETPKFGVRLTPEEREARLRQRQRAEQRAAGAGQAGGAGSAENQTSDADKFKP